MKKILYVEDDKDTAEAARLMLESGGYAVSLAYTGEEGVKKITSDTHDLVLLDMMLPDMSGWDVFQKTKHAKTTFAMLSALPVSEDRLKVLKEAGISDYITKPFKKAELIARVKKLLK